MSVPECTIAWPGNERSRGRRSEGQRGYRRQFGDWPPSCGVNLRVAGDPLRIAESTLQDQCPFSYERQPSEQGIRKKILVANSVYICLLLYIMQPRWLVPQCGGKEKATVERFLKATEIVDWTQRGVSSKAKELSTGLTGTEAIARRCFEWVRDEIQHSSDFKKNPVTCCASEVLGAGTGYCYAKSHLLAALLRANGIPAGFCYQRLSIDDKGPPFSLHGLNAVYLPEIGWYRVDCRGNKMGVDGQFTPPIERLAFRLTFPGERSFPEILPDPLPIVITALRRFRTWDELYKNLPDWTRSSLPDSRPSI